MAFFASRLHRRPSLKHRRPGLPPVRLRPLAGHARRPDRDCEQALLHRHGHPETQGSQGLPARLGQLPRQAVTEHPADNIISKCFYADISYIYFQCFSYFCFVKDQLKQFDDVNFVQPRWNSQVFLKLALHFLALAM